MWKGSVCDFCENLIKDIPPKYFDEDHTIVCEPCLTLEVIKMLVTELDKHVYGNFHYHGVGYRDTNVISALAIGRYWLDSNRRKIDE